MANMKRGTRRALVGFCLAALSVPPGAALFAAETMNSSASVNAEAIKASAAGDVQGEAAALADLGGAIYSHFSPAFRELAARRAAHATLALPRGDEPIFGLVVTTVTAFIAAGALIVLVRMLMAS